MWGRGGGAAEGNRPLIADAFPAATGKTGRPVRRTSSLKTVLILLSGSHMTFVSHVHVLSSAYLMGLAVGMLLLLPRHRRT